jgi:hypothetical protein
VRVPAFLVRRFYVGGSLRNTAEGFELQAQNEMGNGMLVGVRRMAVDGRDLDLAHVVAIRDGGAERIPADAITRQAPVPFRRGDRVTLRVTGERLEPGEHDLEVELIERDLGALQLGFREAVNDGGGATED